MNMFAINQDGCKYDGLPELQTAIDLAEELLGGVAEGELTTFTVESENGTVLAAVSNRRIIGTITKQRWGGRKDDEAINCGEEDFDATDAILLLPYSDLVELEDNSEETDSIGTNHVSWDGPHSVSITDSICHFFGVTDVEDITEENLSFVRNRMKPQPSTEETITLTVNIKLRVSPAASVTAFIDNLDYSFKSNTVGVTVSDTEIVSSN